MSDSRDLVSGRRRQPSTPLRPPRLLTCPILKRVEKRVEELVAANGSPWLAAEAERIERWARRLAGNQRSAAGGA
jgi:hypothetical protein